MNSKVAKPSELTSLEQWRFITFVSNAGEVNKRTLPALVSRAAALAMLYDNTTLIGTAAIKTPYDAHRRDEFRKANVAEKADAYPLELGWVVIHQDYRRRGHARALLAEALEVVPGQGIYATTKTDSMRKILPEHGFVIQGDPYPSELTPEVTLTLFARSPQGMQLRQP